MTCYEQSIAITKLWIALHEVQMKINNDILPLAAHLQLHDDAETWQTLELAQSAIQQFLASNKLQITENKK